MICGIEAVSLTSITTGKKASPKVSAKAFSLSRRLAQPTTRWPLATKRSANALPKPALAPVINTFMIYPYY